MAEQVDVYIENLVRSDIRVTRHLPDGSIDLDTIISHGDEDRFFLPGFDVYLSVGSASEVDIRDWSINVRGDADYLLMCLREESKFIFKLSINDLPPMTPTTVNITVYDESD